MTKFIDFSSNSFILFAIFMMGSLSILLSKKARVLNFGVNAGIMGGSVGYIAVVYLLWDRVSHRGNIDWWMPILGGFSGMLLGLAITFLFSFAVINLEGDNKIIGAAINVVMPALSATIVYALVKSKSLVNVGTNLSFKHIIESSNLPTTAFHAIIAIIAIGIGALIYWSLYKTTYGKRISMLEMNEEIIIAGGLPVRKIKHVAMAGAGLIAGFVGSMAPAALWQINDFKDYHNSVLGMGYLLLAMFFISRGNILRIAFYAIIFGMGYSAINIFIDETSAVHNYIFVIPYIGAILVWGAVNWFSRLHLDDATINKIDVKRTPLKKKK